MISKILQNIASTSTNAQAITGLDATFLYIETPTSPMHVGSVAIIEGSLSFEDFRKTVQSRIHLIPKLRQRLIYVPMSIDYPYWVDDPYFDIDMHLHHIALPQPGSWKELRSVASRIFSEPLDQSRPLWSFTFVEGLDNMSQVPKGSVAIISKIHHVAIDGVAGAGILALLFDMSPKIKEMEPEPFNPEPLPDELSILAKSTMSFVKDPLKFPKLITNTLFSTLKAGAVSRVQKMDLPTAPFTAPPTPLNGIISPRRKWNTTILSLARVKKLKNIMETTFNDVMLAICAGALRRYLLEKNKLPNRPLVAMVPISTRTTAEANEAGNQISSMLVQLATNIEDPIERLKIIHENTNRGKTYHGAIGAKTLGKMAEAVPFGIANQAARLYSRFHVSRMHNPVFNVTITNVPGPPFPLYLHGHKMLNMMGMAPIIDGMGLIITIFSYNGAITISPTSDANTMPDINVFTRYLREAANELENLILDIKEQQEKKEEIQKTSPPKSDIVFEQLRVYLKENATTIPPKSGLFQFTIKGASPTNWRLDLNKTPATLRRTTANEPDASFIIEDKHLMQIAKGELDFQTAFVQGRLKLDGNPALALQLGQLLNKVFPLEKT